MGDGYDCEKERIRADMLLTTAADCCLHRRRPGKPSKFPLTATKNIEKMPNRASKMWQKFSAGGPELCSNFAAENDLLSIPRNTRKVKKWEKIQATSEDPLL